MFVLAALLVLAVGPLGPVSKQNTTAETVSRLSLALGIDFDRENEKAEHPAKEGLENPGRPAVGVWLEAELAKDDDEISDPPAPVREFLETRRDTIGGIVSALEKASPDWGATTPTASEKAGSPHRRIVCSHRFSSRGSSRARPWSRSEGDMGSRPIARWKRPGRCFGR